MITLSSFSPLQTDKRLHIWTTVLLLLLWCYGNVSAQTSTKSITDGYTPVGLSPGTPAGSFGLSGFDTINVFNGNLNFRLPLHRTAGRGSASHTILLAIDTRWRIQTIANPGYPNIYSPTINWWDAIRPGYGPGFLSGRQTGTVLWCGINYHSTFTRLTFTAPDGTELELRDQLNNGAPGFGQEACGGGPGILRGKVFVSSNGVAATFISDFDIYDTGGNDVVALNGYELITPSGFLLFRDGTRYRIDSGRVTWARDRNGNKTSFTYDTFSRVTSITDSINRQVTIVYDVNDGSPYGVCDRITYKGGQGATRTIRVSKTSLSNALRSGQSLQTYGGLFPDVTSSGATFNPTVISTVWLPDGRNYQFKYNSYAELARVVLPTGGAYEYDWAAGATGGASSGTLTEWEPKSIYRRVIERRAYADGVTLEGRSTFSRPEFRISEGNYGTAGYVTVEAFNPAGARQAAVKHYFYGNSAASLLSSHPKWTTWKEGKEHQTEQLDTDGTTVRTRVVESWQQRAWVSWAAQNDSAPPVDPRVVETVSTLEPAGANLVSKKTAINPQGGAVAFDIYNNQTDVWEYGFNVGTPGSLIRRTRTQYVTTNPVNSLDYACDPSSTCGNSPNINNVIHLRSLPAEVQVFDAAGVQKTRTTYEYDNYTTDANHAALVNRSSISGLDSSFTTTYHPRGNSTAATRFLLDTGGTSTGSISTYDQYDIAGNIVKNIDGRSYATNYDFADRYGTADGSAQLNSGATELGSQVSYAFATKVTNRAGHFSYTQFDYYLARPVDAEDPNGIVSSFFYNDPLDRPSQLRRAVGTSAAIQTTFGYDDTNRIVTSSTDLNSFDDNLVITKAVYDGLGRTTETRKYEGGGNYILVKQDYDSLGRVFRTSNPFRPWQGQSAVWTTQVFDALGRVTSVTTPDNAVVSTSFSGNSTIVTDQAGKARKSVADALGRVIEVYEDPNSLNHQTTYMYDVLDGLVKITQGSQQRFFMYDSLKRLIRTRNPEQATNAGLSLSDPITSNSAWSTGFQYDANGNLTQKTDARGVVSTSVFDTLDRNTTTDYSDTPSINPDIKRFYDGPNNGKGRFWYFYSGGDFSTGSNVDHSSVDSYDPLGRPLVLRQLFKLNGVWGPTYQTSRAYNRAGGVTSQTYPSGRSVAYSYDSAGRISSFTGTLGDSLPRTYATGITYSQWGSPTFEEYGTNTPLYNKLHYNIRGQLYDVRVSNANEEWSGELGALVNYYSTNWVHGGSGTDNNGNVLMSQTIINSYYMEDRYTYDALNRVSAVNELQNGATHTGSQQYNYDRWGNRTILPASWGTGINNKQFTVDTTTNRLGVPGGQPGVMSYDNAGNLTTDTYTSFGNRVYDAENMMTAAQDSLASWSYYTYDADRRRTRRKIGGQETWHIYGLDNELLAEYPANGAAASPQKENGYRNGQLLVTTTGASCGSGYVGTKSWSATSPSLGHNTGQAEGSDWAANVSTHAAGHMVYGPYDNTYGKGRHQARFQLQVDNTSGTDVVATLDVVIGYGTNVLAQRQIRRNEFTAANTWQWFSVDFDHPCFGPLEARIYWHDTTNIKFRETQITNAGAGGATVYWLVTDHLGTPRMVFDQAGSYATVKRHDYLPFGEELFAGAGGRSTALGYGGDGVRQQFTGKERDIETGLDYFVARYYSSTQGRFASADSFGGSSTNPQTLNLYAYTKGNPLRYVDPTGHFADESPHGGPVPKPRVDGGCNLPGSNRGCLWMGQQKPTQTPPKPTTSAPDGFEVKPDGRVVRTSGGAVAGKDGPSLPRRIAVRAGGAAAKVLGGVAVHLIWEMAFPDTVGDANSDIHYSEYEYAWENRDSFLEGRFSVERLEQDTVFYRVLSHPDYMAGMYLTEQWFTSSSQARQMLALSPEVTKNTATHIVSVVVPKGTVIARGQAAPQNPRDKYPGGGSQVMIGNPYDPRIQWVNPTKLGP